MMNLFWQFLKLLKGEWKKTFPLFFSMVLCNTFGACLEGCAYYFLIKALTALSDGPSKILFWEGSFSSLISLGLAAQVLKSGLCFCGQVCNARLSLKAQYTLQTRIYQQIMRFSFTHVNTYKSGELGEYVRIPMYFIGPFFAGINNIFVTSAIIIVSLVAMGLISLPLTFVSLVLFALGFLVQKAILKRISRLSGLLSHSIEAFGALIVQNFSAMRLLHLYNYQKSAMKEASSLLKRGAHYSQRLLLLAGGVATSGEVIGILVVSLSLLFGHRFLGAGSLPLLLGFIAIAYRMISRIQAWLSFLATLSSEMGYVGQVVRILDDRDKEFISEGGEELLHFEESIEIKALHFSYPKTEREVLKGCSLTILQGTVTAFVGESGGGKSSLLALLTGLYPAREGAIFIDGHDLAHLNLRVWRELLGVVSQDASVFNETIAKNIAFGRDLGEDD